MTNIVLVLDAIGVIYNSADDVAELLVPLVVKRGGIDDPEEISRLYTLASLGELAAGTFWNNVGLSQQLEDDYLAQHKLMDGLLDFLDTPLPGISSIWCLSNDIAEWSRKLRAMHGLEQRFAGFMISGEVGARKPSPTIYEKLLERLQRPSRSVVFVDDRERNLDAAMTLGCQTVLFDPRPQRDRISKHVIVASFTELAQHLAPDR